jgi:type IV secretion system protein VirB10
MSPDSVDTTAESEQFSQFTQAGDFPETAQELDAGMPEENAEDAPWDNAEMPEEPGVAPELDMPEQTEEAPNPDALDGYGAYDEDQEPVTKQSYEASSGEPGRPINRAQRFDRSKTLIVLFSVVVALMLIFIIVPKIRKPAAAASPIDRAGKVYIPDMITRAPAPANQMPKTTGAALPPEQDNLSDEQILADLEQEMKGGEQNVAPVYQSQAVSQTQQSAGESSRPTTNRNPLQKAVTHIPRNQGQTAQPASNGGNDNPYAQFGLPLKSDYVSQAQQAQQQYQAAYAGSNSFQIQNNQSDKQQFASTNAGNAGPFQWNSDYSLFKGTIIPAVLETGINSDLPGAVIARVTKNVYSSLDGKYLLIPEGSRLYAMYNSSISYSQRRVQIAWTTLIRPDGFEFSLGNMQAVDLRGFTGQSGAIDEHYFEYLKAMGVISAFSIANGELDNSLSSLNESSYTDQLIAENRAVINQLGAKLIDRALDIQPTITVAQGTQVNVLTNVTIELPPMDPYPVTQKYIRK